MEAARRIAVADASPCIALARIEQLGLLPALFDELLVPRAVFLELLVGERSDAAWTIVNHDRVSIVAAPELGHLTLELGDPLGAGVDRRGLGPTLAAEAGETPFGSLRSPGRQVRRVQALPSQQGSELAIVVAAIGAHRSGVMGGLTLTG